MSEGLLQTKLYKPPLQPSLVPRLRLIEKLNEGLGRGDTGFAGKVSLVSAPPGFGKTTLILEWLEQLPREIGACWLSLESGDDDPARFFAYVVGALQTIEPAIGRQIVSSGQVPPPEVAAEMLVHDLATVERPLILVLDDHHLIGNVALTQALAFMLERLPPQLHLVLIGRADPPFSLSRLRVRRQLVEVRAQDLRFTLGEATEFLNRVMGLQLAADEVAFLESRTEGWVAGLQLAAHSLQLGGDKAAFLNSFAGDDRYVADYLMEEVLAQQPESVRSFLFQTSILTRLNGRLCDAVLLRNDGQKSLEFLEQANLFIIPLDNRRHWYRYHHLFAELLQERLDLSSEEKSQLHLRASRWYEENGLATEAIEHALSAGDHERSVGLITENVHQMFQDSQLATVLRWWQRLPPRVRLQSPKLAIMAAWAYLATGQSQESEQCLAQIEATLGQTASILTENIESVDPAVRNGLIEVATIRTSIQVASSIDAHQTLAICKHILPFLVAQEERHLFNPMIALRPVAFFNMGHAYRALGRLGEAADAFNEAIELGKMLGNAHIVAGAHGHMAEIQRIQGQLHQAAATCRNGIEMVKHLAGHASPLVGMLYVRLGQLAYEWNELERGADYLEEGIAVARRWQNREALLPGYLGLCRTFRALGREEEAQKAERAFLAWAGTNAVPSDAPSLAHYAWLKAANGELDEGRNWLESAAPRLEEATEREEEAIFLVRLSLLAGELDRAKQWLDALLGQAETGQRWGRVIELSLLHALLSEREGGRGAAMSHLERALRLAEKQGYVRTFLEAGRALAGLLQEASAGNVAPQFAATLLAAFPEGGLERGMPAGAAAPAVAPTSQGATLPEPLSQREVEVLQLIAGGLTNKEIAARLHLAPGTVKVHAHNLYSKLGVSGRTQAVAAARALDLLP